MKFGKLAKLTLFAILLLGLMLASGSNVAQAHLGHVRRLPAAHYRITIENLTEGQPLTPPLLATHRRATDLFTVGEAASFELKEIAENGNLAPMQDALSNNRHVSDVVVAAAGDPPPLLPGDSVTVDITAARGARFLSFASMLICTNDGFTGLDSLRLPLRIGRSVTVETAAYDAGTEINTEDFADMVPPCPVLTGVPSDDPGTGTSNPDLAEDGVIHHHPGIQGIADLDPGIHGWTDPVAKVTIERVPAVARYEVTFKNLTGGQPLTPPVVATHRWFVDLFNVGREASFELKEIAENGNLDPMVEALSDNRHVFDSVVAVAGDPPPLLPGEAVTIEITASRHTRFLSFASMLICTNDGFTGLDTLRLPRWKGRSVTVQTAAYDAGTEINTEDFADIVPPCPVLTGVPSDDPGTGTSNPDLAQGSVIRHHPGIQGVADLVPEIHDWTDPVAEVTITRID